MQSLRYRVEIVLLSPSLYQSAQFCNNNQRGMNRFIQKRLGKNLILVNEKLEKAELILDGLHQETKKMERRETMYEISRLLEKMHKGEEKKKYWLDTIRHYHQKKSSFFVTSVLAAKKISVPLR